MFLKISSLFLLTIESKFISKLYINYIWMDTEGFEFDFIHQASANSVKVKRFAVDQELHLWTLVRQPRADERIFKFYEGPTPEQMWWHSLNDKRDELMKLIAKPLARKVEALKKNGKIKTYRFRE